MVDEDRNKKYTCPVCGSEVRPIVPGNKTKDGKVAQVSSHFSHFDASKCNSETAVHWWFKNKILINGDSFVVKTDVENEYKCKELLIEQSYNTEFGIYKPDITIITECGKSIYFEMNYTNKKKVEDYMDKWLELGNLVVEVDIKMLMEASFNKSTYEFRALFYEGKCFNTKKNDLYYDTVGQFKERICKNNTIDDNTRERIKKLDWFWMETINYKRGETNIEQLVDYIDYAEQDEKDLIFMILSKKRCVSIYEDYVNYKMNLFEKLANDCVSNLLEEYKECFTIKKEKISKKHKKTIECDTIHINNSLYYKEKLVFSVVDSNKKDFLNSLMNNINSVIELLPYHNKSNRIFSIIKDKFEVEFSDFSIRLNNESFFGNNISYISISENTYPSYNSKLCGRIFINKLNIQEVNGEEGITLDILDDCNEEVIIDHISKIINMVITKHKNSIIGKEVQMKLQKKKEMEKILSEIKEEKFIYRKYILNKITSLFDNNKDKIVEYQLDYNFSDDFTNLLYFKDYKGHEFIIYSEDIYLHKNNPTAKTYHSNKFNLQMKESDLTFIDISLGIMDNVYITEIGDSYEISNHIYKSNHYYDFPSYFNNSQINVSFRDMGYDTKNLPRYDFTKIADEVNNIIKKVNSFKHNFVQNYYKTHDNEIYYIPKITDEGINNEIFKLLYPMINLSTKYPNNILNIKFNVEFTMEGYIKQPWLIKDFIEALGKLGVKNIHNII